LKFPCNLNFYDLKFCLGSPRISSRMLENQEFGLESWKSKNLVSNLGNPTIWSNLEIPCALNFSEKNFLFLRNPRIWSHNLKLRETILNHKNLYYTGPCNINFYDLKFCLGIPRISSRILEIQEFGLESWKSKNLVSNLGNPTIWSNLEIPCALNFSEKNSLFWKSKNLVTQLENPV